jgi:hypothetical protein
MALFCPRELSVRRITVNKGEMVFLRHVIEASEGLALVVAESGGDAFVMSTKGQASELDRLLADLSEEMHLVVWQDFSEAELDRLVR